MDSLLVMRSLAAAGFLLAASHGAAMAEAKLKAVASFSILGDMVAKVGGDRVVVTTLVGPDGDAHVYEPTPADAKSVAEANVFIVNGLSFEGWLERLTKSSGYAGPIVVATKGIKAHKMAEEDGHDPDTHTKAKEHDQGHEDPHAWQSLKNGLVYVKNIAEGLCTADPQGCDRYKQNADRYSAEIEALDKKIRADIAKVTIEKRKVVTSHDAFGYFAGEYGVAFLAPQGISTESEASAADVAELVRQIKKENVTALFVENISDPRLIEQIARETSVKPGGRIYSDALSSKDGPASTYLDMFKHNGAALTSAMLGTGS